MNEELGFLGIFISTMLHQKSHLITHNIKILSQHQLFLIKTNQECKKLWDLPGNQNLFFDAVVSHKVAIHT